jgi:hypothetical protein
MNSGGMPVPHLGHFATEVSMLGAVDLVQPAAAPQLFESGTVNMLSSDPAKVVVSAVGSYSCCDVYLSRPIGTNLEYGVKLYGRVGDARVLLASINTNDIPYTAEGAREGAIACSVRGRPCSALEVEFVPADEILGIQVFLQAWHADIPPEAINGPERVVGVKQGAPATASGRWPVYLSTGSAAQGAVNTPLFTRLSDGTAAQGTPANPLSTRATRDSAKTFGVVGGALTGATSGTTSIGYLWKQGGAARVEIQRIVVSYLAGGGSGNFAIRGAHIGPEAGSGSFTSGTIVSFDRADTSPAAVFKWGHTGAQNRQADLFVATGLASQSDNFVWSAEAHGKPIVLRPSVNEGFEVRAVMGGSLTAGMTFNVTFHWIEI